MLKTTINFSLFIYLLFNLCYAQQSPPVNIDSGMVSYYPFDNASFNDSIGTDHWQPTSSFTNAISSTDRHGDTIGALYSNYPALRTVNSSWPSATADRSFSIWYNIGLLPQRGLSNLDFLFFQGAQSTGNGIGLAISRSSIYFIGYLDDMAGNTTITPGQWDHLVGTYDGDTAKLYHNGQLIASGLQSWITIGTNVNLLHFSANTSGSYNNHFVGAIDDFRIYDRVINAQEVQAIYNRTLVSVHDKHNKEKKQLLYPNPTEGVIYLESNKRSNEKVNIYNISGKLLLKSSTSELKEGLDLSHLNPGLYFVRFEQDEAVQKFILK